MSEASRAANTREGIRVIPASTSWAAKCSTNAETASGSRPAPAAPTASVMVLTVPKFRELR
ncbi:hypothetical protein GCM10023100_36420 [Actinocorallia cavernae]|uniref:DUF397 domain-containing protein n=1 Tax=Actinocorallia cavernae TaxID=328075 RepID=A0ABP8STW3_9ACTN